jgi:hypothetical protein
MDLSRSHAAISTVSVARRAVRTYNGRKRGEGKKHNAAIVCLAPRRCDLIHKLLRTGLTYGELPRAASPPARAGRR